MNRIAALLGRASIDETWALQQWQDWNNRNRFEITPMARAHAVGKWPLDVRDHYTVHFPAKPFQSFLDFLAFEFFHASILQTVARDTPADGGWFRLSDPQEFAETLLTFINSLEDILCSERVDSWLRTWELPDECSWFYSLGFRRGVIRESSSEATLWAETENGYAVFLCING